MSKSNWKIELPLHVLFALLFSYAAYVAPYIPTQHDTYGGTLKFFTKWNLIVSIIYFCSSAIMDLSCACFGGHSAGTRRSRTLVYSGILFPSSMIACLVFWAIYSMNANLMVPPSVQKLVPINGFYNHAVHTAPLLAILLDSLFTSHSPSRFRNTLLAWTMYAVVYLGWILWVAYKADIWVYPFLRVLDVYGKTAFFASVLLLGNLMVKVSNSFLTWYCDDSHVTTKKKR